MGIFDFLNRKKATPTTAIAIMNPGSPQSMPRDYKSFAEEGYQKNVIAYRCIERNADAVASLPIRLVKKTLGAADEEIHDHPILVMLRKPNPVQSYAAFVKSFVGYIQISGNSYIHAVGPSKNGPPKELWMLRPDCMQIQPGQYNLPLYYLYKKKGAEIKFDVDPFDGSSAIRHLKTFHPYNEWYGMSPIEAAAFSLDQHNAVGKWNLSLLQNSARPSGALIMTQTPENPGGGMNENQRAELRSQIEQQYAGAGSAGKFLILEGGMEWKEMSFSPSDMNWIEGKNTSARDISLALGNPPQLLGIPGDSTYNNYESAKLAYYLDTILPLGRFWLEHLNSWLVPAFGEEEGLCLEIDENKVEALEPMRKDKWTQVQQANYLTINEKREKLGYGRYEGHADDPADVIFSPPGLVPLDQALDPVDENGDPMPGDGGDGEGDTGDTGDYLESDDESDKPSDGSDDEDATGDGDSPKFTYLDDQRLELKSKRGKEHYRRQVLAKRQRLAKRLERDIKKVWKEEKELMISSMRTTHSWQEVEDDIKNVLHRTQPKFERIFKQNIRLILESFGKDVLRLKSDYTQYDTKNADTKFNQFVDLYIKNYVGSRITGIYGQTQKRVTKRLREVFLEAMQDGDPSNALIKEVQGVYSEFTVGRASVIVTTETGMAQNEAQLEAAKAMDIPKMKKTWLSEQVERTRQFPRDTTNHWDMNDETIAIDDKFTVPNENGADEMDGPGDRHAPPEQVINCHCVLVFGTGE